MHGPREGRPGEVTPKKRATGMISASADLAKKRGHGHVQPFDVRSHKRTSGSSTGRESVTTCNRSAWMRRIMSRGPGTQLFSLLPFQGQVMGIVLARIRESIRRDAHDWFCGRRESGAGPHDRQNRDICPVLRGSVLPHLEGKDGVLVDHLLCLQLIAMAMPCSCAASSASAISFAIGSASSIGIAPRATRRDRSSPSTSSSTSAVASAVFSTP
jgi:hypothetical protein